MKKYSFYLPYVLACIIPIFAFLAILHPGFYPMHDDEQIGRLFELDQAIRGGQFPPRWVADLGFGYGFPLFNFYPPLVYYIGEIFHVLGFSLVDSTKIVIIIGFLLASLGMFLWVRKHFGNIAGLLSATLITYTHYHSVDLYVRGALSEFFSFVIVPFVFYSFDNFFEKKNIKWALISGISMAFLILAHNLTAVIVLPFIAIYVLYYLILNRKEWVSLILKLIITGFTTFGLTAYFTLPALLEKQYTLVDAILTKELANYSIHFLYPIQLWSSPWGYGGSVEGINDGLSFQIGKIHILLALFSLVLAFVFMFFRKAKTKFNTKLLVLVSLMSVLAIFMTIQNSKFIWDAIQPLWYIQFPWRFLLPTVTFIAFVGGAWVYYLSDIYNKKILLALAFVIIGLVIYREYPYFKPSDYLDVTDANYTTKEDLSWRISKKSFEYLPKTVKTYISDQGTTQIDITENELPKQSFVSEHVHVEEVKNTPSQKIYITTGDGSMVVNTYLFPGWKVFIDNQEVAIYPFGKLQLISFLVPSGNHTVSVEFINTPVRTIGDILTLITIFGLGWYIVSGYTMEKKKGQ